MRGTMHITNISEAKSQLSALIEKVLSGQEVIIGKAGKPVARLIPYTHKMEKRIPGALKGKSGFQLILTNFPEMSGAFGIEER